ncbi:MAG: phosphoglucomutase/phosphomannomutase family protein [PVC group bacterium]|nr:phosphoglucomutase/phosphomannomutase family protein [PVC group bacterium]
MKKTTQIRFGTSGWRAIMADEFTFDNVRLVSQAIADYVKSESSSHKVIVGYDTRFLSGSFAKACAQVLAANKIKVLLTERDTPTPVLAYHVIDKKLAGAINFTASHNPPEYNGIKFSSRYGGPAPESVTSAIEKRLVQLQTTGCIAKKGNSENPLINIFDPSKDYISRIKKIIDLKLIKKAHLKIGIDCKYGTSRDYIDRILNGSCSKMVVFNNTINPLFGGFPPEPDKPYIKPLIALIKKECFDLGLGCDGDGDRFGIVDRGGIFITPNEVVTLLFYYLLKTRSSKAKKVARTLATTHMIDAIARKEDIELVETPVGFKYIGEALSKGDCLIGGEESGGLSIMGHVPEKDGILACLLIAEMVASEKKSLMEILRLLYRKYGYFYSDRINLHLAPNRKKALLNRLQKLSRQKSFFGMTIKSKDLTDGYKFIFEHNCWLMVRPSGTEPILRCYMEASSKKKVQNLKSLLRKYLQI